MKPVVFCGPSGSGKSSLINKLIENYPKKFCFSISHTTRPIRAHEKDGKEYYFVERQLFTKMIENHEFIEYAEYSGNYYGTSKKAVKDILDLGKLILFDLDMQGVKSLKDNNCEYVYIFIMPLNLQILEERLRNRGTETDETISMRLTKAVDEINYANSGNFDKIIVNDDFESAYKELELFLKL